MNTTNKRPLIILKHLSSSMNTIKTEKTDLKSNKFLIVQNNPVNKKIFQ